MSSGLEVLIHAPRQHHDEVLRDEVGSLAEELPGLQALFFGRHSRPDWHLKLSLLGEVPRGPVERRLEDLRHRGLSTGDAIAPYTPELDPHGGPEGARLAERIHHHDARACLAFLRLEAERRLTRTRRELSLLLTERFLDLMAFTAGERTAFYSFCSSWAVDLGTWTDEERAILDARYASLASDLHALLHEPDSPALWGGQEAMEVALALLEQWTPLAAALRRGITEGGIARDSITLTWYLTHLHANRLQIEAHGEAVLRYLMHRYHAA
ncbi:MAG TPA: thiopeptide-type bacteriocin biosynthesis protein [Candidatus Polarisedimenticolaceae bacterium]|nr:thiopeptide-type bacteriocin biosynthesis protein [Candidatus Polarisedimenticolaceae bacterium]